jgi:hypothetical protein
MKLKDHFKFHIFDAKQLAIAMTGAFSTWAATGFQHDLPHLGYILIGFISGGLVSHNSMADPSITPESHIATPYLANIDDGGVTKPIADAPKTEGADVKQIIKINSNLVK